METDVSVYQSFHLDLNLPHVWTDGDSWDTLTQPLQPVWNAARKVSQWETRRPGRDRLGEHRCCQKDQWQKDYYLETGTNEEWDGEASATVRDGNILMHKVTD